MRYEKPEIVELDSAATTIQSSDKPKDDVADGPLPKFSINAYEADE
jgi:hypothetical protein